MSPRAALPLAAAAVAALVPVAPAPAATPCKPRSSKTLRETALVRVYHRPGPGDTRVFVACHKPTDRRRALAREPRGERFRFVRASIRGTLVTLRYRQASFTCKRELDVATGRGGISCVA